MIEVVGWLPKVEHLVAILYGCIQCSEKIDKEEDGECKAWLQRKGGHAQLGRVNALSWLSGIISLGFC